MFELKVTVVAVWIPAPLNRMLCGTTPVPPKTTEPVAVPDAMGKKATSCVQLAPETSVIGGALQEPPAVVVKAPVNAMEATVIGAEPVFARVTGCGVLKMPTPALAKVRAGTDAVRNR